ncbi:hypothetical protein B565_1651 [Aeromonas veronii B565]|nr:hypothetical protein B565_1651 [Aeromonas veronii B565]
MLPIFMDFQGLAISENLFMPEYFYCFIKLLIIKVIFIYARSIKGKGFQAFQAVFIG